MTATTDELAQGYLLYSGDDDLPMARDLDCGCCDTTALYSLEATDGLPGYHEAPAVLDSSSGHTAYEVEDAVKALLDANSSDEAAADANYVTAYNDAGDVVATWARTNSMDAI